MNKFLSHHKKYVPVIITGIFAVGIIYYLIITHLSRPINKVQSPKLSPGISTSPTPALDPLAIESICSRKYSGDKLKIENNLGSQVGYSNSIISYTSDNLKIYALQSTPNGNSPSGGWPVIVLNHGYIDPASYQTDGPEYQQFISSLASAGFVVIKPDYRGHGESQGSPEGGHFSAVYTYDLLNLITSINQTPGLDNRRIGLLGHSMGAHIALRSAVCSKNVKALAVLSGVVGSMDDIFYHWPHSPVSSDRPTAIVRSKRQDLINKYGEPSANPSFWESASAINFVNRISGPVQIHHSTQDTNVPFLFSEHLNSTLRNANKTVEFYQYPDNDHQLIASRNLVLERLINFYKSNL